MGKDMNNVIESTRAILDQLVLDDNSKLSEGKILEVSTQLDVLILNYYEYIARAV
jgi:hypothetical protein